MEQVSGVGIAHEQQVGRDFGFGFQLPQLYGQTAILNQRGEGVQPLLCGFFAEDLLRKTGKFISRIGKNMPVIHRMDYRERAKKRLEKQIYFILII